MTDTMDTRGNISQQRERGRETEMVRGQKKTHRTQNTEQAGKEQATSAKVDTVEHTTATDEQKTPANELDWRERELCHFRWNLKIGFTIDCDRILRNIDHDLEETPNLLGIEGLLFRGYLEVWDIRKRWDVQKAREFLNEADGLIKQADCSLQKGYKVVALLNRMWIEHKCQNSQKVRDLLTKLESLVQTLEGRDFSVIGAVRATALTRLGPTVMATALELFEEAQKNFPENVDFLYGVGLVTGRMARYRRGSGSHYKEMDEEGRTLMDRERDYWSLMMRSGKDEYQLARSALGLNLSRRDKKEKEEGCRYLEEAYKSASTVDEVVKNVARYYREIEEHDKAIQIIKKGHEGGKYTAESYFQLALCYIACSKKANHGDRDNWNRMALEELEKCLVLNKGHNFALMRRCTVQSELKDKEKAEKLYEDCMQQSEHWTTENKLLLYYDFAKFLDTKQKSRIDIWQKVMDITASLEYLDKKSGTWKVLKKANKERKEAHKKLLDHYKDTNSSLQLGTLHFQNFDFGKAEGVFLQLNPESDFRIPLNLSMTYLKMGRQKDLQALQQEATQMFDKAHYNAVRAMEIGLSLAEGRKLRADTALAIAHNQLLLAGHEDQGEQDQPNTSTQPEVESQAATTLDEGAQQKMSAPTTIKLDSLCIQSYREAVRCGSLVASLELLRLIQTNSVEVTSRWTFLQALAEIDVSCSLRSDEHLHKENEPLNFKKGLSSRDRDKDTTAVNFKTIKRDVTAILHRQQFFRRAWKEHFIMERAILQDRFANHEGELELDGRKEEKPTNSEEIVWTACDCCEKLRPLLDRIVHRFSKEELGIGEETKNQYFPLILNEETQISDELKKRLKSMFGIDVDRHYFEMFNQLREIQPGNSSDTVFLKTFWNLVNHIKHSDTASSVREILNICQNTDPVTLARDCTNEVEKICNFFFVAMTEANSSRDEVELLVSDIKDGRHEKTDELLEELSGDKQFVISKGSTWKLLEMIAVIRRSTTLSGSTALEVEDLTKGPQETCQELRSCHQKVEDAVLENLEDDQLLAMCRKTCQEAVKALDAELAKHKTLGGKTPELACLDILCIRKFQLKTKLKKMGIHVAEIDELAEKINQEQRFISKENYDFSNVKKFLTGGGEDKPSKVLDLTRWCTDSTEKILLAMQSCSPRTTSVTNRPKQKRKK